ncbi:DUF2075 domain-containing protein [Bradyrhizobium sp. WSM 1791]|uniref:DUF2075 domain-containing protein n=1 Tax=Bradyrhizobium australiense TaxID=2721161 RepID=A0A7Y4LUV5_9BRAD|nr:DUF2075 domain-containing protein [Bradyrhizobium australiense]
MSQSSLRRRRNRSYWINFVGPRTASLNRSEPEFLISVMDRHQEWCTIVCLVGGGQEINAGEAGLTEWFEALRKRFPIG